MKLSVLFLTPLLLIVGGIYHLAAQHVVNHEVAASNTGNSTEGFSELLPAPELSHAGGWYSDSFNLEVSTDHDSAMILYTLDGSEPDVNNLNSQGEYYLVNYFFPSESAESVNLPQKNETFLYSAPIPIVDRTSHENDLSTIITTYINGPGNYMWRKPTDHIFKGTVVRTRLYHEGNLGPVFTTSFFVDSLAEERYPVPVVSLVSAADNIFGYERGIYVPGKQYFMNGGTATNYRMYQGNFMLRGDEWERPAHIEVFANDGEQKLSQNIGVRIHGNFSRNYPIKGLRLYARNRYDEENMMNFPFIEDAIAEPAGMPANDYKRLILHDYHQRDMVAIQLMQEFNIGTQGCSPYALFYNARFWGITYAKNRFDRHYVANLYGLDPDNVIMLDAPAGLSNESNVYEGEPEEIELYRDMFSFAADNDLSLPGNYDHMASLLDMESYVDYNIMFIYLNNRDWYGNKHFRMWRARDPGDEPYHDGKWRYAIWDFDMSMNYQYVNYNMLHNAMHPSGGGYPPYTFANASRTALLRNLLENADFRHYFINRFADLINTAFHPGRVSRIVDEEYNKIEDAISEHYDRWGQPVATPETASDIVSFGKERPAAVRSHLQHVFGIEQQLTIGLDVSDERHGFIRINSVEIQADTPGVDQKPYPWAGVYFKDIPIEAEAIALPGFEFSHWVGLPDSTSAIMSFTPESDIEMTAVFTRIGGVTPVHYWHFNNLPDADEFNDPVIADYSVTSPARITYPGTGDGYMDRYSPGSWLNIYMEQDAGYALRVRNPSSTRELVFETPTTGYKNLTLSFAVHRSNNGPQQQELYYRISPGSEWVRIGEAYGIDTEYTVKSFDLTGIEATNNNPNLQFRVLFLGDGIDGSSGNNRFDNIVLTGEYLSQNQYTITASAGTNGTIDPAGEVVVADGISQAFSMTPDHGYMIADVIVDGVGLGAVEYFLFEDVASNHTIRVEFTEDDTSVHEIVREYDVKVYPNPANNYIHIFLDDYFGSDSSRYYTFYDLSGREVLSGRLQGGSNQISVEGLFPGVYILKVVSQNQTDVFKIVRSVAVK